MGKFAATRGLAAAALLACSILGLSVLYLLVIHVAFKQPPATVDAEPVMASHDLIPSGIDPRSIQVMKLAERVYELEKLNAVQIRQISQLQRHVFNIPDIGSIGAVGDSGLDLTESTETEEPITTPDELIRLFGAEP
jgi:hypothetical protein